jgi:hypothetical protein
MSDDIVMIFRIVVSRYFKRYSDVRLSQRGRYYIDRLTKPTFQNDMFIPIQVSGWPHSKLTDPTPLFYSTTLSFNGAHPQATIV